MNQEALQAGWLAYGFRPVDWGRIKPSLFDACKSPVRVLRMDGLQEVVWGMNLTCQNSVDGLKLIRDHPLGNKNSHELN